MPKHLKAQVTRELDRIELLMEQIKAVEGERDELAKTNNVSEHSPISQLQGLKGIGPEFAAILTQEGLFRHFDNRRQVAAYAGLAPSLWKSGSIDREGRIEIWQHAATNDHDPDGLVMAALSAGNGTGTVVP
ncbi:hypothetical protein AA101099_0622 [Neoasaia chiangmaiensis NBRC 101099]|uniref:Uncharacterized protein n=1 Tax=Neoasaia chiangmaiensis TaxID=320497 RepID=A0A1U9KLE4_9PROT|nr:hypothetical protein A0U93_00080 [Neoasaia chiangmaiensis]GBR37164.1 hypothetical protein AA101099_0622 [Neoasaia chiangmaiensis NBRC 101099]GEN16482.1 hypothetical protein NCH01_29130 [Neoasaia chiangmaiensis]